MLDRIPRPGRGTLRRTLSVVFVLALAGCAAATTPTQLESASASPHATTAPVTSAPSPRPSPTSRPSPSPTTAVPAPAGLPPDGRWQVELSVADLVAADWPEDVTAPGTYTWTFAGTRARLDLHESAGSHYYCEADMVALVGGFRLTYDDGVCGGEVDDLTGTLEEDGLHLLVVETNAPPDQQKAYLETKPWQPAEPGSAQRFTPHAAGEADAPLGYYEYLPPGYGDGVPRPLLVALHGYGGNGDGSLAELGNLFETGIPDLIQGDAWPDDRPFVVLVPQHDSPREDEPYGPCDDEQYTGSCSMAVQHQLGHPEDGSICMTPAEVHEFLSYAVASYEVDPRRVYLTGLSCGAYALFEYVAKYGATQVAAIVPIAGDARPAWEASGCELGEVAIWAFHGDVDDIVDPLGSTQPMTSLMECPQPPRQETELTIYQGVDHDSWTRTYDLSAGHDIYEWFLDFTLP